jgi:hypothetical protein
MQCSPCLCDDLSGTQDMCNDLLILHGIVPLLSKAQNHTITFVCPANKKLVAPSRIGSS